MKKEDIANVCTFTGHRPERLSASEDAVIDWLKNEIKTAVDEGYTDFITGMARGVDIWAAEEVLRLKSEGVKLRLIAASPFMGMDRDWNREWQKRYKNIIDNADEVHYISAVPGRRAFFERNEWMVDRAAKLIAVYTGAPGGTKKTIEYAKKHNRVIVKF